MGFGTHPRYMEIITIPLKVICTIRAAWEMQPPSKMEMSSNELELEYNTVNLTPNAI
jgi:hypothetical protein